MQFYADLGPRNIPEGAFSTVELRILGLHRGELQLGRADCISLRRQEDISSLRGQLPSRPVTFTL